MSDEIKLNFIDVMNKAIDDKGLRINWVAKKIDMGWKRFATIRARKSMPDIKTMLKIQEVVGFEFVKLAVPGDPQSAPSAPAPTSSIADNSQI